MKTSTEINSAARIIGEEKAIEYISKAGFNAWDFSMFSMIRYDWGTSTAYKTGHPLGENSYLAFARKLKHISEECGIHCNQSHAPFPTYSPEIRSHYKRAIECTAEVGGQICVIHPDNYLSAEENAEIYMEILPFAKAHGVKIATENMWNWNDEKNESSFAACATSESFLAHLNAVNDDYFVACLDIGHAEMRGSGDGAANMIKAIGPKLQALHIHDNDKWHDSHQIPFSMDINFPEVVKALKEINYGGYFTLEADRYLGKFTEENIFEGIKDLANSARKLADMFENEV